MKLSIRHLLLFVCNLVVWSKVSSIESPIFYASPPNLEDSLPWLKFLCKVNPIAEEKTYLFIGISKMEGRNKIYLAKIGKNSTVQNTTLGPNTELHGELQDSVGGYLFIRINNPTKNDEGHYQCEAHYKGNSYKFLHKNSININMKYQNCCLTTADVFQALNLQYEALTTINNYRLNKDNKKIQKNEISMHELSKKLNVLKDFKKRFYELKNRLTSTELLSQQLKHVKITLNKSITDLQFDSEKRYEISGAPIYSHLNMSMVPLSAGFKSSVVMLRRVSGSVDFYRAYSEYEEGFGDMDGNFWLGLKKLHEVTKYFKRLEVVVHYSRREYQFEFLHFQVGDTMSGYKLTVEKPTKADTRAKKFAYNNRQKFTTKDMDQDRCSKNCANLENGGWWYGCCTYVNPTGIYGSYSRGIYWNILTNSYKGGITFLELTLKP